MGHVFHLQERRAQIQIQATNPLGLRLTALQKVCVFWVQCTTLDFADKLNPSDPQHQRLTCSAHHVLTNALPRNEDPWPQTKKSAGRAGTKGAGKRSSWGAPSFKTHSSQGISNFHLLETPGKKKKSISSREQIAYF